MRRSLSILLAAFALTAGMVAPAGAITGNYQDDFVHSYVGLLVFYTTPAENGDPFSHRCSGSLISETVIVTAGHCTEGVDAGRVYFRQSVAPNYDPEAFGGWGGDETTGYPYLNGVTFHRADNYGFHDFEGYPENKDVGVVVLDKPYKGTNGRFARLPKVGQIDSYIAEKEGKKQAVRFTTSGYGISDTTPTTLSFRKRLMATGYLIENQSGVTTYNLKTTANPAQDKGGSCSGDSGGPVLFEGTDTIAAVVSYGMNAMCAGQDYSYRLDRKPVLDWIKNPARPDAG